MRRCIKLGSIIQQIRGVSYKPTDVKAVGDPNAIALLRANNIQDEGLNFDDLVYVDKSKVSTEQMIRKGDIVLCSSSGSKNLVGKAAIAERDLPYAFGAFCKVIRTTTMDAAFVGQYFKSPRYRREISAVSVGANINNIRNEYIDEMLLPVYSDDEQHEIAQKLLHIETLISNRRMQLVLIAQLVKSRFIELFGDPVSNPKGWQRQRFDALCDNLDSRRVPITSTERKAGIYPYYGASGIVDYVEDYIFDEDLLLISEDGANLVMRSTPIAFSISGKAWVNNHAHVVRFASMATQKYIEICFALTDISGSITGTAQPKLNQAKLNAMMFCVPPIELQQQFAAFVEQVDKSKLAVEKGLQELEILKKSLMQKYFG